MVFDILMVTHAAKQFAPLKAESDALQTLLTKFTESREEKYLDGFSKLAGGFIERTLTAFNLEWSEIRKYLELEAAFIVGFQTPQTEQTEPLLWDRLLAILAKLGAEVGPSLTGRLAEIRKHLAKEDEVSRAIALFAFAWPVVLEQAESDRATAERRSLTVEQWDRLPVNEKVREITSKDKRKT